MKKHIELWPHGETEEQPSEIVIELSAVRAADNLVVDYDMERNGYRLRMGAGDYTDDTDETLIEVGFVPAWTQGGHAAMRRVNERKKEQ